MTIYLRGLFHTDLNEFRQLCDAADEQQRNSECDCRHAFVTLSAAAMAIKREFEEMQRSLAALQRRHPEIFREIMDETEEGQ